MLKIAIVEDEKEIGIGLNYVISATEGFSCEVFNNAEKALMAINPDDFDIVLMDIKLPGMSGIECTQILKQKYPKKNISWLLGTWYPFMDERYYQY